MDDDKQHEGGSTLPRHEGPNSSYYIVSDDRGWTDMYGRQVTPPTDRERPNDPPPVDGEVVWHGGPLDGQLYRVVRTGTSPTMLPQWGQQTEGEVAENVDAELPAGRELDALIAERVMGYRRIGTGAWVSPTGGTFLNTFFYKFVPHYSTDIAAAWQVWERLPVDRMVCFTSGEYELLAGGETFAAMWRATPLIAVTASTLPLAICRAALLAVELGAPPAKDGG